MKIVVVQLSDLNILFSYEADAPNQAAYGGILGRPEQTVHLQCSEALDSECVKAVLDNGSVVLEEDVEKTAAKLAAKWQALRAERDRKLSACDWTQLVDSPLIEQDKQAWRDYRQELRDLPENTEDPSAPVWPSLPGEG